MADTQNLVTTDEDGAGIVRKSRSRQCFEIDSTHAHLIWPTVIFLVGAALSIWIARIQFDRETRHVEDDIELIAPVAASRFEEVVEAELRPLRRLMREVSSGTISTSEHFVSSAESVQRVVGSLEQVAWVDANGIVRGASGAQSSELKPGYPVLELDGWGVAFARARNPWRNAVVAGDRAARPMQWICLPYTSPSERDGVRQRGAVMAQTNFDARIRERFDAGTWASFNMIVRDEDGTVVCASGPTGGHPRHGATHLITVFHSQWSVEIIPTEAFVAIRRGSTPLFVLVGGIGVASVGSLGCAQALLHRRRRRQQVAAHLAALEALSTLSGAMSEHPDESTLILQELAEVAARLMGMSVRVVTVYDPADNVMRVVYSNGLEPRPSKTVFAPHETPVSLDCMARQRAMMFDDVEQGSPFRPEHMRQYGIRSLILLPLIVGGESVGVLLLADGRPRRFSETDHQLTKLWTVQATAILSNRRLYERLNAALGSARRLLDQRETLYRVNMTIQHSDSVRDALDRIAELAPSALGVEACVVCLPANSPQSIEIAAVTPGEERPGMVVGSVVPCPTCASVIGAGQVQIISDAAEPPLRGYPDMHSALYVPLHGSGPARGMLVLLRRRSGEFDPEQVRMAEIFAARASSVIESARLHEETARQAETNAILLRELNHRVGNNLASIVGLLSMGAAELPENARHWLDRAIERVSMMARAHELFAGGVKSVELGELIRTTLASVSAIKGTGVQVRVTLETDDLRLSSARAVTLAMVLHELAYNCVVHALSDGGELIVRVRRIDADGAQRIGIDIIDRAAVAVAVVAGGGRRMLGLDDAGSVRGSGIGLQLVRNLVSRELRGSFRIDTTAEGGTCATVELPVNIE